MNKVFVLPPFEDWIVDRFVKEWNADNADISTLDPQEANVIWLMADWCFHQLYRARVLHNKKVITTIHHIVPEKFGPNEHRDFMIRDQVTSVYHVPNRFTHDIVKALTKKPIVMIPYWANQKIWYPTSNKYDLKTKHGIPFGRFVLGSFQRDSEGADTSRPKLEKGPDLLADYISTLNADQVHVVLGGWRRDYLMNRLKAMGVGFSYFERPDQTIINELYQTLDLYPVTARHEGGPQSLIECGLLSIPVVSRPVGIAEQVLPPTAINDNVALATPAVPNVSGLLLPDGYQPYRNLIESLQ